MIQPDKYLPEEIIPAGELLAWREGLKKSEAKNCPGEVKEFIRAVADQLPAFSPVGEDKTMITGYELRLAGMTSFNGEMILDTCAYELPVPRLVAVDHYNAMHRAYNRKGKRGLVDYCKAHVNESGLGKLLRVLDVQVCKQESEEFKSIMTQINNAA